MVSGLLHAVVPLIGKTEMASFGNPADMHVAVRSVARCFRLARTIVLSVLLAFGVAWGAGAQSTSLNVTNFGAVGDAVQILVATVSNSSVVTFPASKPLSGADVG